MRRKFIVISVLLVLFFSSTLIFASELLDQAKSDYFFQLEKYREEEKDFYLKRSQYRNLQTFASQEEAVQAAKVMLIRRAEVWRTYFQAVRIALLETKGVDIIARNSQTNKIETWQKNMIEHKKRLENLNVIDAVLLESQSLEEQKQTIEKLTYQSLGILAIAKLQANTDQLKAFSQKIKDAIEAQELNEQVKQTKLRGFIEIDRSLSNSQTAISQANIKLANFEGDIFNAKLGFENVQEKLIASYDQIRRAYQLLVELSEGVEL